MPVHFENLGKLLLLMSLLWGYFVFNERLHRLVRQRAERDGGVLARRSAASFAPLYWTMVVCNFVLPFVHPGHQAARGRSPAASSPRSASSSACGSSAS